MVRTTTRTRAGTIAVVAGALYLSVLFAVRGDDVRSAQLHQPVGMRLADPFAVEWQPLSSSDPEALGYDRPLPMAATDPVCVGFGRPDWPESQRRPTVARCFDPVTVEQLDGDGVVVLLGSVAGRDTWFLLRFGADPVDVAVEIGGAPDRGLAPLGRGRVLTGGPHVGLLAPTDHDEARIRWSVADGRRFECHLRHGLGASVECS